MTPPVKRTLLSRSIVAGALGLAFALAALVVFVVRGIDAPAREAPAGEDALALLLDRVLQRGERGNSPGLALRPLATLPDDGEAAALAGAVCESMASRLVRVPGLRVASCRSTGVALAANLDDRALSRLLAIDHVMTGEIRTLPAGRLHLRLELRDARDGSRRWAIDEHMALPDLQALPVRVSSATGAALGIADAPPPPPPIDPEAHVRYLRARELARRPSIDDRRAAVRLLDEVLAVEPDHLESRFLQHNVKGWLLGNDGSGGSVESLNAARAANVAEGLALARRLVEADPQDVRGQWLLLADEVESRQWVDGYRRLGRMVQANPRQPGVLRLSARMHIHAGYLERARELAIAAARLNALDADAYEILALVAGMQRRDAEMREFIAIARQVGHEGLGPVQLVEAWRRRDWAEVERVHTAWIGWGGQWSAEWVPAWVRGLADPSEREAAAQLLDAHDAATRQHFVSYLLEYALLGDFARSMKSLRHHAKMPPATWMQNLWWPELAEMRRSPAFIEAMNDLGFTGLWDAYGAPDLCQRGADGAWSCR
jgi:TolB-like protein/tetratricopeptide (TPR) repeat protein